MLRPILASLMCVGGPIQGCEVMLPVDRKVFNWRSPDGFEHQYRRVNGDEGQELLWMGAVERLEPAELASY